VKKLLFVLLSFIFGFQVDAQIVLKGTIIDSAKRNTINSVRVENLSTHQGDYSNADGFFSIEGKDGDYIIFSYLGFNNKVIRLNSSLNNSNQIVKMSIKTVGLKGVTIKQGPTQYQTDSAKRADIYKDAFDYTQTKSAMSPITSLYQVFSKKHKNMRHFQDQIVDIEKQKFIDTRYSEALTAQMTGLQEESLIKFMQAYPMEIDFARAASDLEIKMWIKYNFQEYSKKKK
jgi:hypothetical protein